VFDFGDGFGEPGALHKAALAGSHQVADGVGFGDGDASIDRELQNAGGSGAATANCGFSGGGKEGERFQAAGYMAT